MQSSLRSSRRQASRTSRSPGARRSSTGRRRAPRRPPSVPRGSTSGRTSLSKREAPCFGLPSMYRCDRPIASLRKRRLRLRSANGRQKFGGCAPVPGAGRCDRPIASLRKRRLRLRSANGRLHRWAIELAVVFMAVTRQGAWAVFGRGGSRQATREACTSQSQVPGSGSSS